MVPGNPEQACASQIIGNVIGHSSGPAVTIRVADPGKASENASSIRSQSDARSPANITATDLAGRLAEHQVSSRERVTRITRPELRSGILVWEARPGGGDAHAIGPSGRGVPAPRRVGRGADASTGSPATAPTFWDSATPSTSSGPTIARACTCAQPAPWAPCCSAGAPATTTGGASLSEPPSTARSWRPWAGCPSAPGSTCCARSRSP
jgi:hypothetical protein